MAAITHRPTTEPVAMPAIVGGLIDPAEGPISVKLSCCGSGSMATKLGSLESNIACEMEKFFRS